MTALVSIIMGSKSDWETMSKAADTLTQLGVPHDVRVLSAHRTPDELIAYLEAAEKEGVEVFIAAAGGAAHLAGVVASRTVRPVLGVPMQSPALQGLDSLLSTVQMPSGIPVATFAIGAAGAVNAALFATSILGNAMPEYSKKVKAHRDAKREAILANPDPRK
ncbi:MAG: 5-(carboxyamino)imidazole ribonucleotide mutase [Phycisphaerae bacterium]|nr:5-(carboxyamino)imidazole ribonucleotide mutase [Phycisphaerales bacterium]